MARTRVLSDSLRLGRIGVACGFQIPFGGEVQRLATNVDDIIG